MILQDRLSALRDRWERLSQRERTLVSAMGVTFLALVTLVVGYVVTDGLSSLEEQNEAMRQALRDIETHRDAYLRSKAKALQLQSRLGGQPVQLGGFLEQAAKEAGVEIPESNERPPTQAGRSFTERGVDLRLQRVKLDALAGFLKRVETGPNLVVTTGLSIRTRDDKHQDLDAEVSVSTYEKSTKKAKGGDKGKEDDS